MEPGSAKSLVVIVATDQDGEPVVYRVGEHKEEPAVPLDTDLELESLLEDVRGIYSDSARMIAVKEFRAAKAAAGLEQAPHPGRGETAAEGPFPGAEGLWDGFSLLGIDYLPTPRRV